MYQAYGQLSRVRATDCARPDEQSRLPHFRGAWPAAQSPQSPQLFPGKYDGGQARGADGEAGRQIEQPTDRQTDRPLRLERDEGARSLGSKLSSNHSVITVITLSVSTPCDCEIVVAGTRQRIMTTFRV